MLRESITDEPRALRSYLQTAADGEPEAGTIATAVARAICRSDIAVERKTAGLRFVQSWARYCREHRFISGDDPFAIRYHVAQFAAQELGEFQGSEPLLEVDLSEISRHGVAYEDIISQHTSAEILADPDVAIVGGAARLALKMFAGVDVTAELPISDIDAVISTRSPSVAEKASQYGIDLTGAKIVDGDMRSALDRLATNFDCTMNQAAIYRGKLLYSERGLADVREGNIRVIAKNDPLFGSEGVVLPDGNVYLNRVGFYRGLSFLLRGKGRQLIVSRENIEREKNAIGRYWQILLFVKLLPIQDDTARYQAIGHWHELASRLGVTESPDPESFLGELMTAYPETYAGKKRAFDANGQARWIVGRLIGEVTSRLYEREEFVSPATYTEAHLSLAESFSPYDYESFLRAAQGVR